MLRGIHARASLCQLPMLRSAACVKRRANLRRVQRTLNAELDHHDPERLRRRIKCVSYRRNKRLATRGRARQIHDRP